MPNPEYSSKSFLGFFTFFLNLSDEGKNYFKAIKCEDFGKTNMSPVTVETAWSYPQPKEVIGF